jgi:hypothetical protein
VKVTKAVQHVGRLEGEEMGAGESCHPGGEGAVRMWRRGARTGWLLSMITYSCNTGPTPSTQALTMDPKLHQLCIITPHL